ncbi:sensor histidine kinase [Nonomuraea sp. SYSU D8015]|uniref:sensor histidine kinase n=1 Tax=Nonomuraea sp. SYSU D8015 TaxID=2593644 RepID=UPI0016600AC3|nr:HAMP domain-containing sensor histidine kinase [Nonomuraea sp. SYSU D8015]
MFSAFRSLRVRLVAGTVVLVALALVAIGVASLILLRAQLVARADVQLRTLAQTRVADDRPARSLPGYVFQVRDATGAVVRGDPGGPPDVPRDEREPYTTGHWRVLVDTRPGGESVVAAMDLREIDATIGLLGVIELLAGGVVVVVLAAAGLVFVRRSLRPLAGIESAARQIADGQLSRRVPDVDPRTEVGRLGAALNDMLARIEAAFAARRESEERMRRFVADASHELRTPVTVVRGYAEHFLRHADSDADSDHVRRIEAEARRMGVLVDDLLLLARLDAERPPERLPVDLLPLAAEVVRDARVLAPERDIGFAFDEDAAYVVPGDAARLGQVLRNLVRNALTHTPPGTAVDVRARAEDGHAVVEVSDRGPGLTEDEAARVFERFYRAPGARSRDGSGLGLAIVQAVVAAHGGSVGVASAPGRGTTFSVRLPLDQGIHSRLLRPD